MKALRKKTTGWLATGLMRGMIWWLGRKPVADAYRSGEKFGRFVCKVVKKRREKAVANLGMAFPEMGLAEREAIAARTFENFGRAAVDFLIGGKRTLEELEASTEILGLENLEKARAEGKGILLVTGHLGNWERMSSWLSMSGYPVTVIARDADQDEVNQMVNKLREEPGTSVVARGNAARPALERLRSNECVGILPDQNSDEVFIPFFGHLAGTVLGPGVLHERTGAPVIPTYCVYVGDGRWKMEFGAPLEVAEGGEVKGEGTMRAIHAWLESVIREYPDQWLWFHDRWRSARKRGLLEE